MAGAESGSRARLVITSSVRYTWTADVGESVIGVSTMASRPGHAVAVRPATTDDIEFMEHLFLLLVHQRNPNREGMNVEAIAQGTREAILEQVQGKVKDSTTYVIEFEGERVGRLRVVRTAEQIEVAGIQVLPACQRRGIGTTVITALIQVGKEKDLPVVLQVDKDNPDAERLYLRLGFERRGETPDTYWMRDRSERRG